MTPPSRDRIGPLTPAQATLVLIAVTLALRLWGAAIIGWGTGEAYYLSSARQFHLSYFDQPPLSLWTIWATMRLTGSEDTLVLRAPFVAMFAVSTWLVYRIGARLHSPRAGFYAALIVNTSVLFSLSIGSWMQPDAPMVLFWLATVLVLIEIFFGRGGARPFLFWPLAGLLLGLTFLSKYHAAFLLGGAGLFMLLNSAARPWLTHRAPWLGLAIAALVFSPVIVWNAQNGWASFGFQGGRALAESGLRWDGLLRMIWGQLLYMVPWLALPALWIGARALGAGPRGQYPTGAPPGAAAFLSCLGWPSIVFFTAVALWSDTQFHFHWQAPGYLILFILLGAWAAQRGGRGIALWLWGSALATLVILTLLVSHATTGWARQVFPGDWEDPTALQLHWSELGAALDRRGAFAGEERVFVAGSNWIECGHTDPQVAGRLPLACLGADPRNLAYNVELDALAGWDAYIVVNAGNPDRVVERLTPHFSTVAPLERIAIRRGGVVEIDTIHLFYGTDFRP